MSNTGGESRCLTDDKSIETLLRTLADRDCQHILQYLRRAPMSAPELVERCDIARSTVYRKLDQLEETRLVDTRIRLSKAGTHATEYHITVQELCVECGADGIELVIQGTEKTHDSRGIGQ